VSAAQQQLTCPLCNGTFPGREACPSGCPLARNCHTLCCPHCGYQFVVESTLVRWIGKLRGAPREERT
jgi:hypothetical protein